MEEKSLFEKGKILYEQKKFEDAISVLKKEITKKPKDKKSLYFLARSYGSINNFKNSIKYLSIAIDLDKNFKDAYLKRGVAKLNLEQYADALEDLEKVIKLNPQDENGLFYIGIINSNSRKYKKAIKDFEQVIKINPSNEYAHFNIGLIKYEIEDYKGAIKSYENLICLNPKNKDVLIELRKPLIKLNKFDEAIKYLEKAKEIHHNKSYLKNSYSSDIDLLLAVIKNKKDSNSKTKVLFDTATHYLNLEMYEYAIKKFTA